MARFVTYLCPECGGQFRHLLHPSDAPPPDRCTLCHAWVSDGEPPQEVFVPQAPGIKKSAYTRSVDASYKAIEDASVERANEAASMLESEYSRQPKDEFDSGLLRATQRDEVASIRSDLKITNMRDPSEMREGDTAVVSKPSPAIPGSGFQPMAGGMPNYAPGIGGHQPGATAAKTITADHSNRAVQMIHSGRLNR